jgi:hypothetical protein
MRCYVVTANGSEVKGTPGFEIAAATLGDTNRRRHVRKGE